MMAIASSELGKDEGSNFKQQNSSGGESKGTLSLSASLETANDGSFNFFQISKILLVFGVEKTIANKKKGSITRKIIYMLIKEFTSTSKFL